MTSEEYSARARGPKYSVLDTTKVVNHFGCTLPSWRDDLAQLLVELRGEA